jgi:predicted NUDIX family phosphoesterase
VKRRRTLLENQDGNPRINQVQSMSVSQMPVEHVLCIPTLLFHQLGHFQGFMADATPYFKTLFDANYTTYRPRNEVETDPSYKQLIPYCVFRCGDDVFHYRRGGLQGEARLRSLRSIGIGGHISSTDAETAEASYLAAMRREIEEEVFLESAYTQKCVGLINDDRTDVGRVHLGIVHIFELEAPKVRPREESIIDTGFASPAELAKDSGSFETWSQICLDHLF